MNHSSGSLSYMLAVIRLQDVWLFWPYSFSISPSIQKMDGSHLEGKSLVTLPSYRPWLFQFFSFYSNCTLLAHKHTSDEGLLSCRHCSLLIILQFLIISHPCLFARLCARQCVPPSFIHHLQLGWKWHVNTQQITPFVWNTPTPTELGTEWICAAGC